MEGGVISKGTSEIKYDQRKNRGEPKVIEPEPLTVN